MGKRFRVIQSIIISLVFCGFIGLPGVAVGEEPNSAAGVGLYLPFVTQPSVEKGVDESVLVVTVADTSAFKKLSAEWWQWALSIPTAENPLLDTTGEKCVVGQRGSTWFLAGIFGGGTVERTCSVPEDTILFFPVANSVFFDTPNVCGQGPEHIPVEELRALAADFIDDVTNLSVEVDGQPIAHVKRVQSKVFEVALPEENIFDAPCEGLGGVPAGIYSPAVDDGFYVRLKSLPVGDHTLHFHAENPSAGFSLDVTYNLTVVSVEQK
jgi:hypothetical protein